MLAGLRHYRTRDAVGVPKGAQLVGRGTLRRRRLVVEAEPTGDVLVAAVSGDDRRGIEGCLCGGIAAVEPVDGLYLVAGIGAGVARDVLDSTKHGRMHHGPVS